MLVLRFTMCFALFFASTMPIAAAQSMQYVTSDTLLVENAKTDAKVIATIKKFSAVTVLSTEKGWAHIQYEKQKGYVQAAKLTAKKPATKTMVVHAKGDIYLREKPTASAKKIDTIPNSTSVFVYSSADGWSYIHYNKQKGYVYTSALISQEPTASIPNGFMPKVGLKLTYSSEFLSAGKTTYTITKDLVIDNKIISVAYSDDGYEGYYFLEDEHGVSFGVKDGNWRFFSVAYPLNINTIATVNVAAGAFHNVVVFTQANGIRYYVAKGVGIIKIESDDGVMTELLKINS